jgi:hypothetical protein
LLEINSETLVEKSSNVDYVPGTTSFEELIRGDQYLIKLSLSYLQMNFGLLPLLRRLFSDSEKNLTPSSTYSGS